MAAIAAAAHAVGALCYVDGVHATPHVPVDVRVLGADFYATSAYKWSGPHIGTVVADPGLLETLSPDKLVPAPAGRTRPVRARHAGVRRPGRGGRRPWSTWPRLTPPRPAPGESGCKRRWPPSRHYEAELFTRLLGGLSAMGHVTLYGQAARRAPTAFFTVAGHSPREVAERLAARKVNVWNGDNYAWELTGAFGLRDSGGAVRAGLVHYNDEADVDRLLAAVAELAPDGVRLKVVLPRGEGVAEARLDGTMAMTALGSLLAVLAGLLHDLTQLAVSPSGMHRAGRDRPGRSHVRGGAGPARLGGRRFPRDRRLPMIRRASALREKSWRAAFLRQRDPDAAGRARPRAPSAALAAACPR